MGKDQELALCAWCCQLALLSAFSRPDLPQAHGRQHDLLDFCMLRLADPRTPEVAQAKHPARRQATHGPCRRCPMAALFSLVH